MADIVIVGIGNPYRGDDAVGWAIIDGLMKKVGSSIKLVKQRGDIAELIELFNRHKSVYLVDACSGSVSVGAWQRIDALKELIPEDSSQTSTHGFSVSQAISLAKNLEQLPSKLILYVINGDSYHISEGLSPDVAKSVDLVIHAILNEEEIRSCMNTA